MEYGISEYGWSFNRDIYGEAVTQAIFILVTLWQIWMQEKATFQRDIGHWLCFIIEENTIQGKKEDIY